MADIKTVQLIVNSEQAKSKLDDINKRLVDIRKKRQTALEEGNAAALQTYTKEMKSLERQATKMQTRATTITKTLKNLDKATPNELKATIREVTKELNSGKVARGSKEWTTLNETLRECNGELKKIKAESKAAEGLTESIADFGTKWVGIIGSIQMGWEVLNKVRNMAGEHVDAYTQMAEAESQVVKYTGMTTEEVKELNEEFKKMDTRTSREQLNALAGDAGRLGITGKQDVLDFVEAADMINVALGEDLGEDAVKNIGKLAQLFGDDDKMGLKQAMISTGSVINHLGSISSASESYIVDFTGRLSSMAATAKMSQADVMGLAAVLDQGMVASEQASTALSSIIQKLYKDTSGMASAVGLNVKEFATLLKTDANEALMTWLDAVNKMGGMDVIAPLLGDLKLSGAGVSKTIATLAGNIDQVRSTQEEANKAFQEGTSILSEVEKANSTPLAQLEKAKNLARDASAELGEHLFPIITGGINTGTLFINILTTIIGYIKENWTTLLGITAAIGAYTIAVYAATIKEKALLAIETLKLQRDKARLAVTKALTVATTSYTIVAEACKVLYYRLTKQTIAMTAAQTALNAAMSGNPIGAVLKVAVTLVSALGTWLGISKLLNKEIEQSTHLQEEQQSAIQRAQKNAVDNTARERTRVEELVRLINSETEAYEAKKEAMLELERIVPGFHANISDEIALTNENTAAIKNYIQQLENKALAEAYHEELVELQKKKIPIIKRINELKPTIEKDYEDYFNSYKTGGPTKYSRLGISIDPRDAKRNTAIHKEYQDLGRQLRALNDEGKELIKGANAEGVKGFFDELLLNGDPSTPTYTPPSDDNKNENKDPKAEAAKKLKEALELEKAKAKLQLEAGLSNQAQYDEAMLTAQLNYFDEMKKIYPAESKELVDAELQYQEAIKKHSMTFHDWSMKDLERQEREETENVLANYAHGTINEEQYRKEMERIHVHYLRRRANLAEQYGDKEGAAKLNAQAEEADLNNQLNRRKKFEEEAVRMQQEYAKLGNEKRKQAELKLLKELVAQGLIPEDKLDEYTAEIEKKFAETATEVGGQMDPISSSMVGMMQALDNLSDKIKDGKAQWQDYAAAGVAAIAMVSAVMQSASQYMQANYQAEEAKLNQRYDAEIEAAGKNSKRAEQLEEEKQRKLAELKTEAAKKAMPLEIAQATASTAMAAINAYASASKISPILGPIAAAAAVAAGALQIATIKKQHEAQMAGYYEGGFTGGNSYHRTAGVVHEGEFVANHRAVNNPNVLPVLRMLDYAQRNNTIASVSSADIAHAAGGGGGAAAVAPVVIHETSRTSEALERLNEHLTAGIRASVSITGEDGFERQWDKYNRMKRNAH